MVFLHAIVAALKDQFKEVEEESIRDNFVVVYELLDEMMDFGHPQLTDIKVLQEYITQESNELDRQSSVMVSAVPWRPEGIFYKKNELFLDVVESLNLLMDHDGKILRSDVAGSVNVNAYLSGMPVLRLGLNDASKKRIAQATESSTSLASKKIRKGGKYVELEDVKFHQCVQLDKFDKDRTITFIPPDGKFELLTYRISKFKYERPLFMVKTDIDFKARSRVLISAKIKSQFKRRATASSVDILIPVPDDAASPRFKAAHGSVVYAADKNAIVWTLKNYSGGLEHTMKAELWLSSVDGSESPRNTRADFMKRPVEVKFEIPYLAVSGLEVRYLKVTEDHLNYQSLPWVRYLTKSGDEYAIRLR